MKVLIYASWCAVRMFEDHGFWLTRYGDEDVGQLFNGQGGLGTKALYAVLFFFSRFLFSSPNVNQTRIQTANSGKNKFSFFFFFLSSCIFLHPRRPPKTSKQSGASRRQHTHASTPFDNRPCMRMRGRERARENKRLMYYATDEDDRKITRQCCRKTRRRKQTRDSFSLFLLLVVQGQTYVSIDNGNDECIVKNMRTIWERIEAKGEKSIFTWPPVKGAESVFVVMLQPSKTTRSWEASKISINHLKAEIRCYSSPVAVCLDGVEIRPRREHPCATSTRATNTRTRHVYLRSKTETATQLSNPTVSIVRAPMVDPINMYCCLQEGYRVGSVVFLP